MQRTRLQSISKILESDPQNPKEENNFTDLHHFLILANYVFFKVKLQLTEVWFSWLHHLLAKQICIHCLNFLCHYFLFSKITAIIKTHCIGLSDITYVKLCARSLPLSKCSANFSCNDYLSILSIPRAILIPKIFPFSLS